MYMYILTLLITLVVIYCSILLIILIPFFFIFNSVKYNYHINKTYTIFCLKSFIFIQNIDYTCTHALLKKLNDLNVIMYLIHVNARFVPYKNGEIPPYQSQKIAGRL